MKNLKEQVAATILAAHKVTFLTGAGVSTASGIPDYRSLKGVYHDLEAPEYLLSHDCLLHEPAKFYQFVKHLYHPEAKPNVIHEKIAKLETEKERNVWTVSQNIDGLHEKSGSRQLVNFHGTLYQCHCRQCGQPVPWQEYLKSDRHHACGGQIRPEVVLYGEGFTQDILEQAVAAVAQADVVVVVGTTFQVHPFCDLIHYTKANTQIIAINQTPVSMPVAFDMVQCAGEDIFQLL